MKFRSLRVGSVAGALVLFAQGLAIVPATAAPDASLAWVQKDISVKAYEGTLNSQSLELTFSGTPTAPGATINGNLRDIASVDLTDPTITRDGHATVTLTVNLPSQAKDSYVGNIQLTEGGKPLPQPLHVTVQTARWDANSIPSAPSTPSPDRIGNLDGRQLVIDEIILGIDADVPDPDALVRQFAASNGAQIAGSVPADRLYELRVPGRTLDDLDALSESLGKQSGVAYASLVYLLSPGSLTNDPIWQPSPAAHVDQNWNLTQIDAPGAWELSTGAGVRVGIIDVGFYIHHDDLLHNVISNGGGGLDWRHGTHVAGTACASGNNGLGSVGVAYNCQLMVDAINTGSQNTLPNILTAMEKMAGMDARVVNMSWVHDTNFDCRSPRYTRSQTKEMRAIIAEREAISAATSRLSKVLWVFSAGNGGNEAPGTAVCSLMGALGTVPGLDNVVSVGATKSDGTTPRYSVSGDGITIAAPGGADSTAGDNTGGVYSSVPKQLGTCMWTGCPGASGYGLMSGTSMAAPHVTGTAALAFSANPKLGPAEVKKCLTAGATAGGKKIAGQAYSILNAKYTVDCALGRLNQQQGTLANVQSIVPGDMASFAVKKDGTVWGWGPNYNGELGNGTTTASNTPVQVPGLSGVSTVSTGVGASFALKKDGTVWGWGNNGQGALGIGSTTNSLTPVQVPGIPPIVSLASRSGSAYAVGSDGSVWAWGNNFLGVLGNGTDVNALSPVRLDIPATAREVHTGGYTAYVLTDKGTVWSWGENGQGQLGNGTRTASKAPVQVSGLSGVKSLITSRGSVVYAVMPDQTLKVWGEGSDGALGNGTFGSSSVPIDVPNVSSVAQVVAEPGYTFARLTTGTVLAWGNGWNGAMGTGNTNKSATPTPVVGISNAVSIATGGSWSLALLSDGTVRAWGYGFTGTTVPVSNPTPVTVSGLSGVSSLAAGSYAAFAVKSDGSAWSWGGSRLGRQPTDTAPAGLPALM